MNRILIAEDEERIALFVDQGLTSAGYTTTVVSDGVSAYEYARSGSFDLLILDLGLPMRDGLTVLRDLRAQQIDVPVIILTAKDAVPDRVAGLEGGADDYITKPFAFAELLARVRVRLRGPGKAEATQLTYGTLTLDLRTRYAHIDGRQIELTAREFALTEVLLRHPGQVLSREQLLDQVWKLHFDPGSNIVEVYVRNLRRKLGNDRIETVRGMGYRLAAS